MPDISTQNLDSDQDNPRLARVELLETVGRVNVLTQRIKTDVEDLVRINTGLQVDQPVLFNSYLQVAGQATISGSLTAVGQINVNGGLYFDSPPPAGYSLVSQGPGLPVGWTQINPGDRYRASTTDTMDLDGGSSQTVQTQGQLAYVAGQSIIVAADAENYFIGRVTSYNPAGGELSFAVLSHEGFGEYSNWTINLAGGGPKGDTGTGTPGADGATWYNSIGAPASDLGKDNDYCLNVTTSDIYQKSGGAWSSIGNIKGTAGAAGSKWYTGTGAPGAGVGANGDFYLNKTTGDYSSKSAGAWTVEGNLIGPPGTGGGAAASKVYGTMNRYMALATAGQTVSVVASSSWKTGISWTRSGTSMVFTDNNHGRSVGEKALVRDSNVFGFDSLITAVTTNTFTVTCTDSGAASGTAAAYSMGFTWVHTGATGAITGGTLIAPANWDCVLVSMRIHMASNTRTGTQYNVTLPKGNFNGVGGGTSADDAVVPQYGVRNDIATLGVIGATINYAGGGDYSTYNLLGVGASTAGIQILLNF